MDKPSPLQRSKRIAAATATAEKKANSVKATKSRLAPTRKTPPSMKSQTNRKDKVNKKAKHPQKVSHPAPAVEPQKKRTRKSKSKSTTDPSRKPHKAHIWTHSTDPDLAKIEKAMKPFAIDWAPGDDWWTERIVRDAAPLYQRLANDPPDPPQ